jgi:hypothetical protein
VTRRVWQFVVEVPVEAGEEVCDAIYTAVANAAYDAEPDERDGWDIFVYGFQTDTADDDEIAEFARDLGIEP